MRFKHLEETGYSYRKHFVISMTWCVRMAKLSLCAFVHGFWPDFYTTTVTENIKKYAKKCGESQKK
jgi:hypothetical protein